MMYNLPRFLLIFFHPWGKNHDSWNSRGPQGPLGSFAGGVLSARFFQWPCRLYRRNLRKIVGASPLGPNFQRTLSGPLEPQTKKVIWIFLFGKLSSYQWCIICPDSSWFYSSMGQKPWFMNFEGPSGALGLICQWGSFSQIFPMAM